LGQLFLVFSDLLIALGEFMITLGELLLVRRNQGFELVNVIGQRGRLACVVHDYYKRHISGTKVAA
jgi:hypothetical protein